ncbi:hypothetical protein [Deinococcus cellulosilyticus]|uniref:Uncharacterized protein n=1 Tax=Deinococcus cellulosilyticus (strain DSM 18568 / NBRC 106333 / KACC 11606 / 5516J-15) TaxID=1223518 RepID=A0A511N9Q7_DEIC1|nr:hypothetical protein [Deinococcus cellulosilyticus]GEM49287.1 hypothetical protein DC3_49220 [Deinococcus cellulosilyticus NBRC 106333 = KACC 11606]
MKTYQGILDAVEQRKYYFADSNNELIDYLKIFDLIRQEGYTAFIKWDGGREYEIYTVMITDLPEDVDYIRRESSDLAESIRGVISEFIEVIWNIK